MATKRLKDVDNERLSETNLNHVIKMLEKPAEGTKAWTKKECCAYLGIAYNTTRLGTLIEKHKEAKLRESTKRAEKRGTPATPAEISYTIQEYLEGATVDSISDSLFRGPTFFKGILVKYGVPLRNVPHDYFKPELVPEDAMRDSFAIGEKAPIALIDAPASGRMAIGESLRLSPRALALLIMAFLRS